MARRYKKTERACEHTAECERVLADLLDAQAQWDGWTAEARAEAQRLQEARLALEEARLALEEERRKLIEAAKQFEPCALNHYPYYWNVQGGQAQIAAPAYPITLPLIAYGSGSTAGHIY